MTNALRKNIVREIRGTWKRFLSIALMAFLGAGFFAGINAASRDMQLSADRYLDAQNCFDLEVMSTLGLTEEDISAVLQVDGIADAVGIYSENVHVDIGGGDEKVKLLSLPSDSTMNAPYVLDGTLPQAADECAVPQTLLDITGKKLGDTISITETLEEEEESSFRNTTLTITAVINSPLYLYADSGTNERSTGAVADYLFVSQANILEDYYTELYMTVKGAAGLNSYSDAYDSVIADAETRIKSIADEREQARYDKLTGDAQAEIDDAQKELDDKTAEAQQKIADAQADIAEAQRKIDDGWAELAQSRLKAEREFADAQDSIDSGARQLAQAKRSFRSQKAAALRQRNTLLDTRKSTKAQLADLKQKQTETQDTLTQLNEQRPQLAGAVEQYQSGIDELNAGIVLLTQQREQLIAAQKPTQPTEPEQPTESTEPKTEEQPSEPVEPEQPTEPEQPSEQPSLEQIDAQLAALQEQLAAVTAEQSEYAAQLAALDAGIVQAEDGLTQIADGITQAENGLTQIADGIRQIDSGLADGEAQISSAERELSTAKRRLATAKSSAYADMADAERELEDGQTEVDDGREELAVKQADFDVQIADAQAQLDDARQKVADINKPTWYVLTREGNSGLSSFTQDSENLKRIGFTFPMIFFLVAVLISLSSMTRMVEEQRGLIGTMGALGYSGGQIAAKYLIYAATASVVGSILGELAGFKTLPLVIWNIYKNFYRVPQFLTPLDPVYGAVGLVVCAGCITAATGAACLREVHHTPAHLMRPKAPNAGKRVLLEYITPIWKRLSFSNKVTMRNLFRYKKRFFMTICGIAGCAALVTTGFGLRDSLSLLLPLQYDTVMHYDMIAVADSNLTAEEFDTLSADMRENTAVESSLPVHAESIKIVTQSGSTKEMELFTPSDAEKFRKDISLLDIQTEEELTLSGDAVYLTEQIAEQLKLSAGDTISLRREDGTKADVTIGGIVHNYLSHYAFLSAEGYQAAYGEAPKNNAFFLHTQRLSDAENDAFAAELNHDTRFSAVSSTRTAREAAANKLSLLNQVVFVLIGAAAALAVVVLYNLSNINISERIRELATIKVLGFYDMEVYQYNTRETIWLTLIGTAVGLAGGRALTAFILLTMEMQGIILVPTVAPMSYVIAAVLTVVFASAVSFMTYFSLKKINMVEALKSVE